MPNLFETTTDPFTGLLETSTRLVSASAELYSEVLRTQAEAARELIAAYSGLGGEAVRTSAQTTERAEEAVAEVARGTGRAAERATPPAAGRPPRAAPPSAPSRPSRPPRTPRRPRRRPPSRLRSPATTT